MGTHLLQDSIDGVVLLASEVLHLFFQFNALQDIVDLVSLQQIVALKWNRTGVGVLLQP
jgi:hypothetical protein